jgi:tetratricopeptide (TPR) repeat protein
LGKSDTALAVYAEGLKKFPKSGVLYLEEGVIPLSKKDYNKAISCFEKGIEVQPAFPSNYYWAARLYCNSGEKLWGLIYGELFINLERNSRRTQEISKLLFDTYKGGIIFSTGGKTSISLSQDNVIDATQKRTKLPYGLIYEPSMAFATIDQTRVDLNSLDSIRTNFLKFYKEKFMKDYPNALFSYQDEIYSSGNFEAYNQWLLSQGDASAFSEWKTANKDKWDRFFTWFTANPIKLNDTNRFYRTQYQ